MTHAAHAPAPATATCSGDSSPAAFADDGCKATPCAAESCTGAGIPPSMRWPQSTTTLSSSTKTAALSASAIRSLIDDLGDVGQVLAGADLDTRAALYTSLGLKLVYAPGERRVDVMSTPIGVDIRACRRAVVLDFVPAIGG